MRGATLAVAAKPRRLTPRLSLRHPPSASSLARAAAMATYNPPGDASWPSPSAPGDKLIYRERHTRTHVEKKRLTSWPSSFRPPGRQGAYSRPGRPPSHGPGRPVHPRRPVARRPRPGVALGPVPRVVRRGPGRPGRLPARGLHPVDGRAALGPRLVAPRLPQGARGRASAARPGPSAPEPRPRPAAAAAAGPRGGGGDDDGRAQLDEWVAETEKRFEGQDHIPVPDFWGGLRIVPTLVEFWQGRDSRLHDRFVYEWIQGQGDDGHWKLSRLSP
ncbi:hypothetical protein HIM_01426 [Hirsutella minnesotensis 3608]|nr:hypothetical protein HIM_01426 [Hirsutella minnesotensis 3608]